MTVRDLPADLAVIAERELNENPERREADIQAVREWLSEQPHLPSNIDDQFILSFLRGCKFNLEKAKDKIENLFTSRALLPRIFKDRDPCDPQIREFLRVGVFIPLLEPDTNGSSVFVIRMGKINPHTSTFEHFIKMTMMNMDLIMRDDVRSLIAGDVSLIDMEGMTMTHITQMKPSLVKKIVGLYQDSYPFRPQGLHFYNVFPGTATFFSLVKSFMKKKLRERVHIHSSLESLHKAIPKDILPTEYGGNAGTCERLAEAWKQKVEENREWFKAEEKMISDESKRPGQPKTERELTGMMELLKRLFFD